MAEYWKFIPSMMDYNYNSELNEVRIAKFLYEISKTKYIPVGHTTFNRISPQSILFPLNFLYFVYSTLHIWSLHCSYSYFVRHSMVITHLIFPTILLFSFWGANWVTERLGNLSNVKSYYVSESSYKSARLIEAIHTASWAPELI